MAGRKAPVDNLVLITGDDFQDAWNWADDDGNPVDFPDGINLFYRFKDGTGTGFTDCTTWDYIISGSVASLLVQSETADLIPNRMGHEFVWQDTSVDPTLEKVLSIGNVSRQVPR